MINSLINFFNNILGLDAEVLSIYQMASRTVIIYVLAVILIRLIKRRFFAKPSSFDLVLIFLLGSVISRAITGNVPFFATLGASVVLVLLHTIFSYLTFHSSKFGALIKGMPLVLIEDGKIQWNKMQQSQITENDLLSSLRRNQILDLSDVKIAVLERNGEISVIRKKSSTKVLNIKVENGMQTVRLEIGD